MKPNVVACAALFLLSRAHTATASSTSQPQFKARVLSKPTVSITTLDEAKRTTFLVTDAFGIGNATIALASPHWPQHIALRFQYEKGRGFRRLERFQLTTARLRVRGDMHSSGKMHFYLPDADGEYAASDAPAGEINIVATERNHAMEVTLLANLFVGSKSVKIEWIDAYR